MGNVSLDIILMRLALMSSVGCQGSAEEREKRGKGQAGREKPGKGQRGGEKHCLPDLQAAIRETCRCLWAECTS
jgi:hypothetical protein